MITKPKPTTKLEFLIHSVEKANTMYEGLNRRVANTNDERQLIDIYNEAAHSSIDMATAAVILEIVEEIEGFQDHARFWGMNAEWAPYVRTYAVDPEKLTREITERIRAIWDAELEAEAEAEHT